MIIHEPTVARVTDTASNESKTLSNLTPLMREPATQPNRRSVLQFSLAGMAGLGTVGLPTGDHGAFAARTTDPVSMAMHIHASFSEGVASMDAHLGKAQQLGVDVIWWTEHDVRQAAYGYRQAVDFTGQNEPEGNNSWSWQPRAYNNPVRAEHQFVAYPKSPSSEQPGALRIEAQAASGASWSGYNLGASAGNSTYSTSYIDTTLELDVLAENLDEDGKVVVEIVSSHRPATAGRPAGQYRLQYQIGGSAPGRTHQTLEDGLLGIVQVPLNGGPTWTSIRMELQEDHNALWPDTVPGDASLHRLSVGVMARNGATARVVVDRLRFIRTRQQVADPQAYSVDLVRSLVRQYRSRYPGVAQFSAAEVSMVLHLNAFGGDRTLPAFQSDYAVRDSSFAGQQAIVDFLHQHGATVCLNHPLLGSGGSNALAERLITSRGVRADVIEIGMHSNNDTLIRVFDTAARNGVFMTANGTTDDHSSFGWGKPASWLTGVWSPSLRRGALCQAMRAGRAWFYDPMYWNGSFDLLVDGQAQMGSVLFTSHRTLPVQVDATALPDGGFLELVTGVCDFAGPSQLAPLNTTRSLPARSTARGVWSTTVERGQGVYVRAVVRRSTGDIVGFSNPVWVLPKRLEDTVRVSRERQVGSLA